MEDINSYSDKIIDLLLVYGPKLLLAIVVLVVGFWLIKRVVGLLEAAMDKKDVEATLKRFLGSLPECY